MKKVIGIILIIIVVLMIVNDVSSSEKENPQIEVSVKFENELQ